MFPSEDHSSTSNATGQNQPGNTQMEYDDYNPDDYTQADINKGQRKINYALTLVNEKLVKALEALRNAVVAIPGARQHIDLGAIDKAIKEAEDLRRMVAGIKPPGCDPDWPA